ncbi:MAG TPA: co-chaperone DjlA [Legionella sp.]|nr:co-chaperone DjlA [Legionella sp.]
MNLNDFFKTHSWWGKILGAIFGYLIGGPAGAFFGILVGNFFDRGLISHFSNPHLLYHTEKRQTVQKIFFEATFSIMGHIAKADGRVSEQEIQMAKQLMSEMRLNSEQKALAKHFFNQGKLTTFKKETILNQLQSACRDNRELLKLFIDIQYRAAQVDGLTAAKIKALDAIFSYLGFAPLHKQYRFYEDFSYQSTAQQEYENASRQEQQSSQQNQNQNRRQQYTYRPQSKPFNTLDHAFALLEISSTATKQEVKRAYRRLLSRNHPDKLIAQGLPEEMIKLANDKTHKLRKAYELICENKGW